MAAGSSQVWWPESFWSFMFRCSNSDSGQDENILFFLSVKREVVGKGDGEGGERKRLVSLVWNFTYRTGHSVLVPGTPHSLC